MWLLRPSTRAEMTFPRAERDRLIFVASFSRSPWAPVLVCLSLPARSTRLSFPTRMWFSPSTPSSLHSTVMTKMACERELCSFMFVAPTERFWLPTFMTFSISRTHLVTNDERSFTYTPMSGLSLSSRRRDWSLESKSRISSW
uniref:Uncharacterized protein n=1 Tax=Nothobranchius furzeri TaxID=105023 RepID=A0A8C6M6N3_NOTFU